MKICAISPFTSASEEEILDFIKNCDHKFIVLPGNPIVLDGQFKNHPSPQSIAEVLKNGTYAFVETYVKTSAKTLKTENIQTIPWWVSSTQAIEMPRQIFGKKPTAGNLDNLQKDWSQRTRKIGSREFSFAICGEINGFEKDGSVKMRRELPYDILVNPTHSIMGRWNHLGVKLANLSIGTTVIHVANNDHNHHRITTDVRIYVDGQVMERQVSGNIAWSECKINSRSKVL